MKVRWTPEAEADRAEVMDYIARYDPAAAERMDRRFDAAAVRLERFPKSGRPGLLADTRELIPHPNYRMVYELVGDEVWITTLIHTARQWPPVADDD